MKYPIDTLFFRSSGTLFVMARTKKTRRLKSLVSLKTGSKQDLIKAGEKGKIPSKNKLSKHKNKPKSAYAKYLAENGLKDKSSGSNKPVVVKKVDKPLPIKKEKKPQKPVDEMSGDELMDLFNRS